MARSLPTTLRQDRGITGGGPATGRVRQGVPAFLVTLAPALPLTVVFARVVAAVFETPFLRHRSWPQDAGQRPRAEGAPG